MAADQALMDRIRAAIKKEFPDDTVDVSPGYGDNVHVVIMSRKFDNMDEQQKQDYVWGLINSGGLTTEQKTRISLLLPLSPQEVK